jgi:GNAT superfamily N-acetyltransferase
MKLQFIKYHPRYMKSCSKLVSDTWSFSDELVNASQSRHLYYYFIRNCVDNSIYNDLIIDEETGHVLGILFGSDENHTPWKLYLKNMKNSLILYKHIILGRLGKRSNAFRCASNMSYVDKSIEKFCDRFDGQLNLCVLNKEIQGLGYGRQLIDRYIQFCINEREMENIFLWTDIGCNYGFYERCGFRLYKQFYDDRLTDHSDQRTDRPNGFIYVKNFI